MIDSTNKTRGDSVSLEELIALNEEIASLVRAGVPLELGLTEVAADQPNRLGRISKALGDRMSGGMSLVEAIDAEGDAVPAVYRTVVEAGIRSGRLPTALESLTTFATELLDLRRKIGFALLYPLIVVTLAYGLILIFITEVASRIQVFYTEGHSEVPLILGWMGKAGETVAYWGWIPPLLLALVVVWWISTSGSRLLNPAAPAYLLGWVPGVRAVTHNYQWANFAELFALMVQHEVPFSEGLVLSAEATTDAKFVESAREVAKANERGESLGQLASTRSAIPPFLRWLMAAHKQRSSLVSGLQQASAMYRRRANDQASWLRLAFPVFMAVVVGGGATLLYALTLFLPLTDMLRDLSKETPL